MSINNTNTKITNIPFVFVKASSAQHVVIYKCRDCPTKFNTKSELDAHLISDHPRPIYCNKCPYDANNVYANMDMLFDHVNKIHPRPIFCNHCSSDTENVYANMDALFEHINKMHNRPIVCNKCHGSENVYANMDALYVHINKMHMRSIKCKLCPTAVATVYADKNTLDAHLRSDHGRSDHGISVNAQPTVRVGSTTVSSVKKSTISQPSTIIRSLSQSVSPIVSQSVSQNVSQSVSPIVSQSVSQNVSPIVSQSVSQNVSPIVSQSVLQNTLVQSDMHCVPSNQQTQNHSEQPALQPPSSFQHMQPLPFMMPPFPPMMPPFSPMMPPFPPMMQPFHPMMPPFHPMMPPFPPMMQMYPMMPFHAPNLFGTTIPMHGMHDGKPMHFTATIPPN